MADRPAEMLYAVPFVVLAYAGTFTMLVAPLTRRKAHLAIAAALLAAAGAVCVAWYRHG